MDGACKKMTTKEHLDFVLNVVCKKQKMKGFTLSPEEAQAIRLDTEEGVDAIRYAREKRAEKARPYNQTRAIIYE